MNDLFKLSSYDYILPPELIAQKPIKPRDAARLMMLDKKTDTISHQYFFNLPEYLGPNDVLVFNDSKVIPARLLGRKETGGQMEVFLLKKMTAENGENIWQCLIKGKIAPEQKILLSAEVSAEPKEKIDELTWLVKFNADDEALFAIGETPLPPYIKPANRMQSALMKDYQTVYANELGSVASPTSGLHFTKELLYELAGRGVKLEFVTLHVGLGTFLPVEAEDILQHKMHSELAEINHVTAENLNRYKADGRRIIAVGTTVARALESCCDDKGIIISQKVSTDIFIYPGYKFKFVDSLITNFHLPKSTLLMLVSAMAQSAADSSPADGKARMDRAYQEAINYRYRFFSFGDGMMIK